MGSPALHLNLRLRLPLNPALHLNLRLRLPLSLALLLNLPLGLALNLRLRLPLSLALHLNLHLRLPLSLALLLNLRLSQSLLQIRLKKSPPCFVRSRNDLITAKVKSLTLHGRLTRSLTMSRSSFSLLRRLSK